MAEEFYKTKRKKEFYRTYWNIYPKLLRKIKFKKDEKVLDAGCGNGVLAKYLKIPDLHGFDSNEKAVREAKKRRGYKKVTKGNIYNIPFKDKEFDKTICIEVLEYLAKPQEAFKELLRVTKKEVIISSANFNWYRINSHITKGMREQYKGQISLNENFINAKFFKKMARDNGLKLKITYISNKVEKIRNLFGNYFASEIVGSFKLE